MSSSSVSSQELLLEIQRHEVAVSELKCLPDKRAVYHKNGNIFFRTSVEKATVFAQRQVDAAKAKLETSNLP